MSKPILKSKVVQPPLEESKNNYFQAVGLIKGTVFAEGDKFKVRVDGRVFPLMGKKRLLAIAIAQEKELFLRVYPKAFYEPGNKDEPKISFQLVAYQTELKEGDVLDSFILKGYWQFIPQYRRPVISVYRNEKKWELDSCRAAHIPLLWRNSPVKAFFFNKDNKDAIKDSRYFCQAIAAFIPERNTFSLLTLLAKPVLEQPNHITPVKPTAKKEGK